MNEYLSSKSETIGVSEVGKLMDVVKDAGLLLTSSEFAEIMSVFGKACQRVLKENGVE